MARRSKTIACPSLKIDKIFLQQLGKIIEADINLKENRHFTSCDYTIKSRNETLTYSSMDELLKIEIFPKNIRSMTFRTNNYKSGKNYVTTFVELDNRFYSLPLVATITTENEKNLLFIEKALKELFEEYKSSFYILNTVVRSNFLIGFIILSVACFLSAFFLIFTIDKFIDLSKNWIQLLLYASLITGFFLYPYLYETIFPYFEFNFSKKSLMGTRIRAGIFTLFLSVFTYSAIEFLKIVLK